jgi:predicted AAA+ superfamily ATPase
VKEVWKDREHQDDVHLRDNIQEKRSLADRFGLTIVYSAPDKDEYLAIVTALAKKAGLTGQGGGEEGEDELKAASLTWAVRHGGRSGRTARQFIDYRVSRDAARSDSSNDGPDGQGGASGDAHSAARG